MQVTLKVSSVRLHTANCNNNGVSISFFFFSFFLFFFFFSFFFLLLVSSNFKQKSPLPPSSLNQISSPNQRFLIFSDIHPPISFFSEPENSVNGLLHFIPTASLSNLRLQLCSSWSFAPKSKCRTLLSKLTRMKTFVSWFIIYITFIFFFLAIHQQNGM